MKRRTFIALASTTIMSGCLNNEGIEKVKSSVCRGKCEAVKNIRFTGRYTHINGRRYYSECDVFFKERFTGAVEIDARRYVDDKMLGYYRKKADNVNRISFKLEEIVLNEDATTVTIS